MKLAGVAVQLAGATCASNRISSGYFSINTALYLVVSPSRLSSLRSPGDKPNTQYVARNFILTQTRSPF
jgi:hypothetical protein